MRGIGLVIDALDRGGAERVVISIANGLDPSLFDVHVFTTRRPGALAGELGRHVTHHSLDRRSRWSLRALWQFARLLDSGGIDIVHSHGHTSSYFVRLARLLSRRRWAHVVHDHQSDAYLRRLESIWDPLLLKRVDYFLGVSEPMVQRAIETVGIPADKCEHLPNGVDVPALSSTEEQKNPAFTVVQVARVYPVKNQLMAIRVASRVKQALPDLIWWLVGGLQDEEYVAACQELAARLQIEDTVQFLGERSDIPELLGKAHVGVLTSALEGLPVALLEYLAYGLPVVVTDVGACRQVVAQCGGEAVVAPDDIESFAQAVIRFADREWAAQVGRHNHECALAYHSSAAMVQRVRAMYDRLAW